MDSTSERPELAALCGPNEVLVALFHNNNSFTEEVSAEIVAGLRANNDPRLVLWVDRKRSEDEIKFHYGGGLLTLPGLSMRLTPADPGYWEGCDDEENTVWMKISRTDPVLHEAIFKHNGEGMQNKTNAGVDLYAVDKEWIPYASVESVSTHYDWHRETLQFDVAKRVDDIYRAACAGVFDLNRKTKEDLVEVIEELVRASRPPRCGVVYGWTINQNKCESSHVQEAVKH